MSQSGLETMRNGSRRNKPPGADAISRKRDKRAALALPRPLQREIARYQKNICQLELDTTALKSEADFLRAEAADLKRSRDFYARLFDSSPVGWMVINSVGAVIKANQRLAHMLGFDNSKHLVGSFSAMVGRSHITEFLRHLRDCKTRHKACSTLMTLRRRDGLEFPALLVTTPLRPADSQPDLFETVILDQREHSAELRSLFRHAEDTDFRDSVQAILWEADGGTLQKLYISKHVEQVLGYPAQHWLRHPDSWLNHIVSEDRSRYLKCLKENAASRTSGCCEYRMSTADRRIVWLRDSISVVDQNGKLRLRGVCTDITEQKEYEEAVRKAADTLEERVAERTAELEDTVTEMESFSYTLSHDMRAPLRAMHGYSELLLQTCRDKLDAEAVEFLERIQSSARRLDELILDVLRYSKLSKTPVQLETIDPEKLLQVIIKEYPLFQEPRAKIEIQHPLLPVMAHEGFLTQCFSNLLSNAVKFVRPGVTPHVRICSKRAGNYVRIWFEDNGIGISPEDQRRIFGIFHRVYPLHRYEGTGLGLAIVERAMQRMGGKAGVESTLGKGSKFWLQFRRGQNEPRKKTDPAG